ncbi:methyltransferase domain-containing protein [Microbacterium sp. LRZ72]|uniref:SAM-dependent methyltransferase n=1 Tax=Microbacterium sp. LRZ72 TaxID=2942481 RepID=UPI0029B791D8|nr:class I SAM-dependent methyltransferase [Microbacterium sp. LRZ72]MDX2376912.1 methyltransferase domain-containing protein [Microbacterium sp. LRZ72]
MTTATPAAIPHPAPAADMTAEETAERILAASRGWAETMAIHLGDRLGWYRELAVGGPLSATELAERTATSPRYAREWLEHQVACGMLALAADERQSARRFGISSGAAEALTDERSLNYAAPLARMFAASAAQIGALLEAYRTGAGISWAQFGDDARESQAAMNRPWFDQLPEAFEAVPRLNARLCRPGARVADVGCGFGWSSIALARTYPHLQVTGFDIDIPSLEAATRRAHEAGVADRVNFRAADARAIAASGPYDAVFAFECIHDMSDPVDVLAAMRTAVAADGAVVIMEEAVGDELQGPADDLEQLMYAFSLFVCLPDGLSHSPSAATGTVIRPRILRDYAQAAGFADIETLPIQDFGFWRFYELTR